MDLNTWPHRTYAFDLPLRYHLSTAAAGAAPGVVICLHGFQDHARSMIGRLGWLDDPDLPFRTLAVNAPFPVPVRKPDGFAEAYAWYFHDATSGFAVGSPAATAAALANLVRDLNLNGEPIVILGFSQGAYLAPFVARELDHARAIIGLGGGFPRANYDGLPDVVVHGIHGGADEVIAVEQSRTEHAGLAGLVRAGEFIVVENLKHRVTPAVEPAIRRLVRAALITDPGR